MSFEFTIPISPRMKGILTRAQALAYRGNEFENEFVSSEHLLIALLDERESIASIILREHGFTQETIRAEVKKVCENYRKK